MNSRALYRVASRRDKAFGEIRNTPNALGTDYKFTGQREEASLGLYWFQSRWFDPSLGRFTSPDTIVPTSTQGTQAWDRYAFVNNNPVRYNDPTGHQITNDGSASHQFSNQPCHDTDDYKCPEPPAENPTAKPTQPNVSSNVGWQSPEFRFNGIDLGVSIISGSYQIEGSSNADSPVTVTNNDIQVGPLGVDYQNFELSSSYKGVPGMSIGINEPGISVDATSTMDVGNLHVTQTVSLNVEFRIEAPAALAVLAGGYELALFLLGTASRGVAPAYP